MGMANFHFDIDESVNYVEHIGFWPIAENLILGFIFLCSFT